MTDPIQYAQTMLDRMKRHFGVSRVLWRPVLDHPGYEVSSAGEVRSVDRIVSTRTGERNYKGKLLKPSSGADGYQTVCLGRGHTRPVHQLVCEAFCGPRPPGNEARHLNADTQDNAADNIAWGTRSDNIHDKAFAGTPHRVLSAADVRRIRADRSRGTKIAELSDKYGVNQSSISAVLTGRSFSYVR